MEKKSNAGIIVLIVVLLLVSLGLAGFIVYDKVLNKPEDKIEENINTEEKTEEIKENQIDINDRYVIAVNNTTSANSEPWIEAYLVDDGYLYYQSSIMENTDAYIYDLPNEQKMNKYTEINNIKRIKGINNIAATYFSILVITETGKVYNGEIINGKLALTVNKPLEKYEVDDILVYTPSSGDIGSSEPGAAFTIITKDGQKITQ
ncbi:hypothetical protein EGR52_11815 [bacterium]|nr:hypothetical protein [bacterium]